MVLRAEEPRLRVLRKGATALVLDVNSEVVADGHSPDPAWTLCVRGTFLDSVGPAATVRRRSSDPGVHSERPSFFVQEEGYAKQLSEKMNGLGAPFAVRFGATLSSGVPTSASACSGSTSESSGPGSPTGRACPWDTPLPYGFPGSECVGHPALCRLPCRDAASCRLHCGRQKTQYLDKKSRQVFDLMSRHAKIEALRCVMRAKVDELGLGAKAAQATEEWHAEVAAVPPVQERSVPTPGAAVRLQRRLEGLHLNDLCCGAPVPHDVKEAMLQEPAKYPRLSSSARAWLDAKDLAERTAAQCLDHSHIPAQGGCVRRDGTAVGWTAL